ncbi:MAG: putative exported protein [Micavibrio sp.]|nr:putative exported protein [Micavibrio sp.]
MNVRFLLRALFILLLGFSTTPAFAEDGAKVASIVVLKSDRRMITYDAAGKQIESYRISLGRNPKGPKEQSGDQKTPEGRYTINGHNKSSSYFLSLRISYPDEDDIRRAKKLGVDPGGGIFIHGQPNKNGWNWQKYSIGRDWTNGCISVTNGDMKELWNMVEDGTQIEIRP